MGMAAWRRKRRRRQRTPRRGTWNAAVITTVSETGIGRREAEREGMQRWRCQADGKMTIIFLLWSHLNLSLLSPQAHMVHVFWSTG